MTDQNTSAVYSEKQESIQSAIRIGRKMFNKTHPDFSGMSILSTILGGYFGSRLMSNIREDKGYTYGIGSALVSLAQGGYFFIATEVGAGVTVPTLKEIYYEINRLQEEPVKEEELKIVKNYLAGAFMRSIDGPFAQADKWKGIYYYGLNYDYYERYLETLRTISPQTIQGLANKYLGKNELTEVVVGKK
jgi:predicted Zn-dependent peptidase